MARIADGNYDFGLSSTSAPHSGHSGFSVANRSAAPAPARYSIVSGIITMKSDAMMGNSGMNGIGIKK